MLHRVLEPELMDSHDEALVYDAMDHTEVNRAFVDDLLTCGPIAGVILDLGTGNARIPIELCTRDETLRVIAIDLAASMLDVARVHVELADLTNRILLDLVNAKRLPHEDSYFQVVMSNSIVHHPPEPGQMVAEAVRVLASGGRIFFRDLMRPADDAAVQHLVDTYAVEESPHARQMFDDSLRASLSVDEMQTLVERFGFDPTTVQPTSDRHWTWSAVNV